MIQQDFMSPLRFLNQSRKAQLIFFNGNLIFYYNMLYAPTSTQQKKIVRRVVQLEKLRW